MGHVDALAVGTDQRGDAREGEVREETLETPGSGWKELSVNTRTVSMGKGSSASNPRLRQGRVA